MEVTIPRLGHLMTDFPSVPDSDCSSRVSTEYSYNVNLNHISTEIHSENQNKFALLYLVSVSVPC